MTSNNAVMGLGIALKTWTFQHHFGCPTQYIMLPCGPLKRILFLMKLTCTCTCLLFLGICNVHYIYIYIL